MMRILITGGGTGGHLSVAEAIAEQLHALGHCLYYLGAKAGQEAHWFDDKPLFAQKLLLDVQGIANKTARTLPRAALAQASAAREALAFLRAHGIERVFSVGGYAAAPACFAALWARIPLYIHEQNAAAQWNLAPVLSRILLIIPARFSRARLSAAHTLFRGCACA